jgi:hypothetical protein
MRTSTLEGRNGCGCSRLIDDAMSEHVGEGGMEMNLTFSI